MFSRSSFQDDTNDTDTECEFCESGSESSASCCKRKLHPALEEEEGGDVERESVLKSS